MPDEQAQPRGNPFATRHVRPGAIDFLFSAGQTLDLLLHDLKRHKFRAAIIGPHGTGKSTLLAALLNRFSADNHPAVVYRLHDGQRRLPRDPAPINGLPVGTLVVVDGYEQLAAVSRWTLRWTVARRKLGLLVTSHSSTYLPTIYTTQTSLELAEQIVAQLQTSSDGDQPPPLITRDDIAFALAKHPTNLRETLFELYDLYEQRAVAHPSATPGATDD